jgi:GTP-binding protein HflX
MILTHSDSRERALLVALDQKGKNETSVDDSLIELRELAESAGAEVVGEAIQRLAAPTAQYFIGPGKAMELAAQGKKNGANLIIFDDELSPAQSRNLERLFGAKIIDRTELILDIFAQRAKSREGKLQIELAQLQYLLPRLTHMWSHLGRQKGGIGLRGPGETQLEVDRRRVQEKIARLQRELEQVRRQRATQREGRRRHQWPIVAIVGYTNAGKSTLLNTLTGANVESRDMLFATLDPTTRRLPLTPTLNVLMTDTVGFLRKLPIHLVDAFRATLEEVQEADLIIHVVDASHPQVESQMKSVESVLADLSVIHKPRITVFNKSDLVMHPGHLEMLKQGQEYAVAVSCVSGQGIEELKQALAVKVWRTAVHFHLRIPDDHTRMIARLHETADIFSRSYEEGWFSAEVRLPTRFLVEFESYFLRE